MERTLQKAYLPGMADTMDFQHQAEPSTCSEPAAVRDARLEREEAIIAKAEAEIDAGLGIEDADVEAWLDALDEQPHAPHPAR